ncbi:Uncharacterised protein [Bordetella pertussis]|nr:DUF4148 domain-containing protein [Bordetella pertussis]CFW90815.1 Uncharacterised protein [Bordetella pertussis]
MRTFTSAALLAAALFGFNAFAGSGELDYPPAGAQGGSLTRSQVQHELAIARAAGQLVFGEAQEPAARPAGPPPIPRKEPIMKQFAVTLLALFGVDAQASVAGPQRLLPILSGEPTRTERH